MAGKTGNILALYAVLYRCTDEDHPLTMREIQDKMVDMGYNCSEDTILRHMRLLREWDVKVEGSMGRNAKYYLGNRLLKKEELKLIVDAINASNFIGREIAAEMVQKLKELLSENQRDYLDRNVLGMVNNKTENQKILDNVDKIQEACDKKVPISFTYMKWNKDLELVPKSDKAEIVNPWSLIWADDRYYLYAIKNKCGKLVERHYRVDKMTDIKLLKDQTREGMVKVREICPNTYVSRRMGMFTGDERKITVAASEEMVGPIIDQFGKNIKVCANPDKTDKSNELLIEFYAVPSIILLGWLIGLGDVEVIGPKEVKEDMIDLLKKTSAKYDRQG